MLSEFQKKNARVRAAYWSATGNWEKADYFHYIAEGGGVRLDAKGKAMPCWGRHNCNICTDLIADAEKAENEASAALVFLDQQNYEGAVTAARAAVTLEGYWREAVTWPPFEAAIRTLVQSRS